MKNIEKNSIEWVVFAISLALIVATVAYLVRSGSRYGDDPADVIATPGEAEKVTAGYRVPVTAKNVGHAAAEQVLIEVTLREGEREVAKTELAFAFVPRRSERRGFVVFDRDPQCCRVEARVVSFEQP